MSTPHSLPPNSHRTTPQLPFSPSANDNTARAQGARPHSGNFTGTVRSHTRSGSVISNSPRPQQPISYVSEASFTASASGTLPIYQPRPAASMTHAGGILPSASFFHPSRPDYRQSTPTPPPPRSSTPGSVDFSDAHGPDAVRLAPLSQQHTQSSDVTGSPGRSVEEFHRQPPLSPSRLASMKYSREPLLPLSGRPHKSTIASRPSTSTQSGPYERSDTNVSTSGKVRESFERLFKRGPSIDTTRMSNVVPGTNVILSPISTGPQPHYISSRQTSPITPSARQTDVHEDDRSPVTPTTRYKGSSSPIEDMSTMHHTMFIHTPPTDMKYPLSETPRVHPQTGRQMRNYELYPSRNRFYFGGKVLIGGDSPWAFIASLTVVLGITGIYFATTCVWWWHNESPAVAVVGAYMCLLTISSMLATAFRDPGILPRNLDPEPPYPPGGSSQGSLMPLPRDLRVRAGIVRVKYCPTCRTYRPPRSSHCKICDNCVDGCDHHCQWVNNCVGRRNYTSFFTFLFSAVLTLVLVICTTALHLYLLTRKYHLNFKHALHTPEGTGSAVAFCLSILIVWPVCALLAYHLRLLLLNITTIEQIRNQAHSTPPPNPFSHGNWRRNLAYMLCRSPGSSWIDASAVATEDKRDINPGMLQGWNLVDEAMEEGRAKGTGEVVG